jgi:hypothetical protein
MMQATSRHGAFHLCDRMGVRLAERPTVESLIAHHGLGIRGAYGHTIGHWAAASGCSTVFDAWRTQDEDMHVVSANGDSIGHMAGYHGHKALLQQWIKSGGNPGVRNRQGKSIGAAIADGALAHPRETRFIDTMDAWLSASCGSWMKHREEYHAITRRCFLHPNGDMMTTWHRHGGELSVLNDAHVVVPYGIMRHQCFPGGFSYLMQHPVSMESYPHIGTLLSYWCMAHSGHEQSACTILMTYLRRGGYIPRSHEHLPSLLRSQSRDSDMIVAALYMAGPSAWLHIDKASRKALSDPIGIAYASTICSRDPDISDDKAVMWLMAIGRPRR